MKMSLALALIIITTTFAGCADVIPEPPTNGEDPTIIPTDWIILTGEYVVLITDVNNSTYETVWIDVNTTYGWIELHHFNYTAVHLSFEIINNSVKFHNYTFNVEGYLYQNSTLWNNGYAHQLGNASLQFATFPIDVTVNYEIQYRVWNGRE